MSGPQQLDLLGWTPPQAELAFDEQEVRAATLSARYSRSLSVALRECGKPRTEVAKMMSEFLGERVSASMIDAYTSVSRDMHRISLPRFAALVHATRDRRLLQMIAGPMGWAVVERRHLPLIQMAQIREREDELRRERELIMRQARRDGAL